MFVSPAVRCSVGPSAVGQSPWMNGSALRARVCVYACVYVCLCVCVCVLVCVCVVFDFGQSLMLECSAWKCSSLRSLLSSSTSSSCYSYYLSSPPRVCYILLVIIIIIIIYYCFYLSSPPPVCYVSNSHRLFGSAEDFAVPPVSMHDQYDDVPAGR